MQHITKLTVMLFISMLSINSKAQSEPPIKQGFIDVVETNNTTLKAYKDKIEAAKLGARVGLNPANPEARFSRTSNGSAYNQEIELTQEIDFPTVYVKKRKISNIEQQRLTSEYDIYRRNVVAIAYNTLAKFQYAVNMKSLANQRAVKATEVQELMQQRFQAGDISVIELSKSKMETAIVQSMVQKWEMQSNLAKQDLALYVGDVDGQWAQLASMDSDLTSFEGSEEKKEALKLVWVEQNNDVLGAGFQKQLSEQNIGLTKAQSLPKFIVGYRREQNPVISMNGAIAGISIPLWENKNKVKQAKAEKLFAESSETDARLKANLQFESVYQSTIQNQEMHQLLISNLPSKQTLGQLSESLQTGYISLLEYYTQLKAYYELENQIEATNMAFKNAYIELFKVAL